MTVEQTKHIIVGSGFGGLCLAAQLTLRGEHDFIILEKSDSIGGTWRDNIYPGAECDVPSPLYSYSFWPNPHWQHKWSNQQQIISYIHAFADAHKLQDHVLYGHEVNSAAYNETLKHWRVKTEIGNFQCQFLSFAVGQLHHPSFGDLGGLDEYQGEYIHSARWPEGYDCSDKRVAVIGNAASAVQLIPEVAESAKELTVYQRSPNWCLPKRNREYTKFELKLAERFPIIAQLYRFNLWAQGEYALYSMIRGRWPFTSLGEWVAKKQIENLVSDPVLREKLVPNYPIGAKRILFATDYFKALDDDHVELVTDPILSLNKSGVITKAAGGEQNHTHDLLILATGFHTNPFLKNIDVTGVNEKKLSMQWQDGAHAYMGVQTANFPNMFMLYGPNTNTGHTSIIFKLEAQCQMILKLIDRTKSFGGNTSVAVSEVAEINFNKEIQKRLANTAWNKVEDTWYKDGNRITNNWPGSSREYKKRASNPIWEHFVFD